MSANLAKLSKPMCTEIREAVFQKGERILLDMNHHAIQITPREDGSTHVFFAVRVKEEGID